MTNHKIEIFNIGDYCVWILFNFPIGTIGRPIFRIVLPKRDDGSFYISSVELKLNKKIPVNLVDNYKRKVKRIMEDKVMDMIYNLDSHFDSAVVEI